jgi:ADP-ribosylglycohydrolase
MNTNSDLTLRILGSLWGAVVGDALGVPVEFTDREDRRRDPVVSMRGGGTWRQPPGTWSDDSSLLLCSVESLLERFSTDDMGRRFVDWHHGERWTPWGQVFDIGMTTRGALRAIASGSKAELAGGVSESSNGNGSLMRIIPVALNAASLSVPEMLDRVHRASAITHRHSRSQMACGLYSLLVRRLLQSDPATTAWAAAKSEFQNHYSGRQWSAEIATFNGLLGTDLIAAPESVISSGGYVLHTLVASVWCLLNTGSYADAVLRAVNLGGDTDTTACVTGGLAGLRHGRSGIPNEWIATLARWGDIDSLFHKFASTIQTS